MIKILCFIAVFIIPTLSPAQNLNCDYNDVIHTILNSHVSCQQAFKFGQSCFYGTTIDLHITNAINIVCNEELEKLKPSQQRQSELANCRKLCIEKYEKEEGTMYISLRSICYSEQGRKLTEILHEEASPLKPSKKRRICESDEDIPLS